MGAGVVGARAGLTGPGLTNSQPPFATLPSPPLRRSLLCPVQRGGSGGVGGEWPI